MKIHEFQAKELLRRHGVNVPEGQVVENVQEVKAVCHQLGSDKVVVKSQIHAGGRGKGKVYDGEDPHRSQLLLDGGVKVANSVAEAEKFVSHLLGGYLHTIQTGPIAKKVRRVYLEKVTEISKEYYLSLLFDRSIRKPVVMASTEGGMDIEQVAAQQPQKIIKLPIEPGIGMQPWQARYILFRLNLPQETLKQNSAFLIALWNCFLQEDANLLEINPLVLNDANQLVALDCKFTLDDNAAFRHPETVALRDLDEEEPLEVQASKYNLSYIRLNGNVGCMVNGAGLAMATMDIIKLAAMDGVAPANFLDVGGSANVETVSNGFRIILADPNVKAIFINIFGGIVQCDRVADGIVEAAGQIDISVPLVVRLQGTNAAKARKILAAADLPIIAVETLQEGAEKVAAAVNNGE